MDVVNAMFLSAAIGAIIALPAIYTEIFRRGKDLPILMDVHACWGGTCTDAQVFALSIFVHFIISIAFGGLYMAAYLIGIFQNFSISEIALYTGLFYLLIGLVVLPIMQLGWFGRREGNLVWLELLGSNILFGLGFWLAFKFFPVFLPF